MIGEPQWITIPQAASLLDLRKRTVKRWVRTGRLQSWRDPSGNLGVSLKDVETLRRELFAEQAAESIEDDQDDSPLEKGRPLDDASAAAAMGEFIADTSAAQEPKPSAPPEPETAAQNAPRDPLSALEHQAERSIQVAGAAYHEAKELAVAYREELQSARQEHREELQRVRRIGHVAWFLVAAAVLVILAGSWYIGRQYGDQKLHESRVSHLTDRLGEASAANRELQTRIEAVRNESEGVASELRTARLGQADAVGQLAAYRAHAGQLSHRVEVLETRIQQERSAYKQELDKAKQKAALAERNRLAMIRQERAEQAERERQRITQEARAQREAAQRQQEQMILADQQRQEQQRRAQAQALSRQQAQQQAVPPTRDESLAQVDQRTRTFQRRNASANLTLTELEEALTPKK